VDAQPSDNYFDLLPDEPLTIHLKTGATLEQVKSALTITSLVDAFSSGQPQYRVHGR